MSPHFPPCLTILFLVVAPGCLNVSLANVENRIVPSVILAHPTAVVGSVNGSIMDCDDFAYNITVPFAMQMYGHNSNKVWVSTNGLLSLDTGSWVS